MRFTVLLALAATFTLAPALTAQEAPDTDVRTELRSMVTERAAADEAGDRAAMLELLEDDAVRQVAAERGVDMDRVEAGVRAMDAGEVSRLADRFLDTEGQLVGGDTIVISTTTIIIILLVLILLSV